MLIPDYRQDNLLLCQPTKAIENYYKGYCGEITYFYQQAIPLTKTEFISMPDIWLRDYMPFESDKGKVLFTYQPDYQSQKDSERVTKRLYQLYPDMPINPLKLEGGHLVFNAKGLGFLTEQVIRLNHKSKSEIEAILIKEIGLKRIVWLPENQEDITGHADGFIQFLSDETLLMNDDSDKDRKTRAYYEKCLEIIKSKCPFLKVIPVFCRYDETLTKNFPSACGIYTNFVQTKNALFVPQYDLDLDKKVLDLFQSITDKTVVPVPIAKVAKYGGSLHCLTNHF